MTEKILMSPPEMRDTASFMRDRLGEITSMMQELKSRVDQDTDPQRWSGKAREAYVPMFCDTHAQVLKALDESITGLSKALDTTATVVEQFDDELTRAYYGQN